MTRLLASQPPAVLITGCSSGIGRACAIDLCARGWQVFAGVRRDEDCQRLQDHASSKRLIPLLLDVTIPSSIAAAMQSMGSRLEQSGLQALVNNAGILVPGPLEMISTEQFRQQLEVNVLGTHAVTCAALGYLRRSAESGGGSSDAGSQGLRRAQPRIVLIGSISGGVTPPFYGAYSASKHALEALASAWRTELRAWRICVSMIQPDSIATPIWHKVDVGLSQLSSAAESNLAEQYEQQLRGLRRSTLANRRQGLPVSAVVAQVRRAVTVRHPRAYYRVGWRTRAAWLFRDLLPTRVMDYILRKSVQGS